MVESGELHKLLFQKYFCGRASPAQPGAGPGLGLRGRCHPHCQEPGEAAAVKSGSTPGRRAYYGEDESLYPARSALRHVASRTLPVFIGFAEYDPPRFQIEAVNLFKALCERDSRCPPMKQLLGHNHMTEIYHIGTADQSLAADLVAFVRGLK